MSTWDFIATGVRPDGQTWVYKSKDLMKIVKALAGEIGVFTGRNEPFEKVFERVSACMGNYVVYRAFDDVSTFERIMPAEKCPPPTEWMA